MSVPRPLHPWGLTHPPGNETDPSASGRSGSAARRGVTITFAGAFPEPNPAENAFTQNPSTHRFEVGGRWRFFAEFFWGNSELRRFCRHKDVICKPPVSADSGSSIWVRDAFGEQLVAEPPVRAVNGAASGDAEDVLA